MLNKICVQNVYPTISTSDKFIVNVIIHGLYRIVSSPAKPEFVKYRLDTLVGV